MTTDFWEKREPPAASLTYEETERIREVLVQVQRDRLVGRSLRGDLPRLPQREQLQAADEALKYQVVVIPGTPDIVYFHGRDAAGTWGWRSLLASHQGDGTELTIASGAITVSTGYHIVDTEADAATDDLDTISGGFTGMELTLRAADSGRTVVVKDGAGIKTAGDMSLDNVEDTITLIKDGSTWYEKCRSDNGA